MVLASWAVSVHFPGTYFHFYCAITNSCFLDSRWAVPVKARVREANQARAICQVNALKSVQQSSANGEDALLRVADGISTQTSSLSAVAARGNRRLSTNTDGTSGRPGNSTIRWGGGLVSQVLEDEPGLENKPRLSETKKVITSSFATSEKAVSTGYISKTSTSPYFANHLPGSNDVWWICRVWVCPRVEMRIFVLAGIGMRQITSVNSFAEVD